VNVKILYVNVTFCFVSSGTTNEADVTGENVIIQ